MAPVATGTDVQPLSLRFLLACGAVGPLLFLIVHAYILMHFVLLADKVGAFHAELQAQIADDDVRARLRRQLPSNIFVQFLAGPREVRTGLMGTMLRLIALISLVLAPLALLLFFVVQFLPYHDETITWWHRIAVVIEKNCVSCKLCEQVCIKDAIEVPRGHQFGEIGMSFMNYLNDGH